MTHIHDENDQSAQFDATSALPQGNAWLPDVQQAEVTHYAYDPETYQILCRPGQRLSEKKAQRLQELNLYAYVVKFAGSQSP
jgi:hypothetical protein